MHKNTRFIIDIFISNPLFLYRPEGMRYPVLEYNDSHTNEHVFVEESNLYDVNSEINILTWYFSTHDKADFLKGHEYTYVGAQPGEIVKCLKRMGHKNGVIFLDELDKVSENNRLITKYEE